MKSEKVKFAKKKAVKWWLPGAVGWRGKTDGVSAHKLVRSSK